MKSIFYHRFFLVIFVIFFSLGQLQRIEISPKVAFYFHDLLISFYIFAQVFYATLTKKKIISKLKKNKFFQKKIILISFLWILLGWGLAVSKLELSINSFLYFLRLIFYFIFVYLLKENYQEKNKIFLLISFNFLVLGFLQYFLMPDLRFLYFWGWDDHYYRLTSTIFDPAFVGLIFTLNLIYYLSLKKIKKKEILLIISFTLGLLLTYSRASYLSLAIALMIPLILRKKMRKTIAIFLVIFSLSIPFLPKKSGGEGVNLKRTYSIQARFDHDKEILSQLSPDELILGQGLFNSKKTEITHANFADSWPVFLISNVGIGGFVIFLYLLKKELIRLKVKKEYMKISMLVVLLVHALFNNGFTESFAILSFLGLYL